jgi:kinesin family protein 4/21/27
MGTGFDMTILPEELGVIPRAVQEIFTGIEERKASAKEVDEPLPQFEVKAQFLEVYITTYA